MHHPLLPHLSPVQVHQAHLSPCQFRCIRHTCHHISSGASDTPITVPVQVHQAHLSPCQVQVHQTHLSLCQFRCIRHTCQFWCKNITKWGNVYQLETLCHLFMDVSASCMEGTACTRLREQRQWRGPQPNRHTASYDNDVAYPGHYIGRWQPHALHTFRWQRVH